MITISTRPQAHCHHCGHVWTLTSDEVAHYQDTGELHCRSCNDGKPSSWSMKYEDRDE